VYVPDVELHESRTLQEASDLLSRYGGDACLLAGGTDLLVDLKCGRRKAAHLVSISRIDELRGVSLTDDGLRIGALTTITQLGESPLLDDRFQPIRDATDEMAAPQIRNMATIGGNIVSAVPCADLPPILTAMNASVEAWSPDGERRIPLESFFVGVRRTALRDNEILSAVIVPAPPAGFGAAYARFALRDGNGIAVASVAASLQLSGDGTIEDARVVLGAVAPVPKLVESAVSLLIGQRPETAVFEKAAAAATEAAEPICDIRGSADYRREVVGVMARRALEKAKQRSEEAGR
jgi:carbon-monoxide dehydrogenase medium subunit